MPVTDNLTARDRQLAAYFGRQGFENPFLMVAALRKADIKPQTAAALLRKESGGGKNVFGHDWEARLGKARANEDRPPYNGHRVTEARARKLFASEFANGVGPPQLTSKSFVKEARDLGGEWKPYFSMRVGFRLIGRLIDEHGVQHGAARYNGGDSSQGQQNGAAYGRDFERIRREEAAKLRGAGFEV